MRTPAQLCQKKKLAETASEGNKKEKRGKFPGSNSKSPKTFPASLFLAERTAPICIFFFLLGQILKFRKLRSPEQVDGSDGAVSLLGNNNLGDVRILRILVIVIVSIEEHNPYRHPARWLPTPSDPTAWAGDPAWSHRRGTAVTGR